LRFRTAFDHEVTDFGVIGKKLAARLFQTGRHLQPFDFDG